MEPAFYRGDILFLHMGFTPFRAGDIVVFKVADREIPIVHRIIKVRLMHGGRVRRLQPQAARATGATPAPGPSAPAPTAPRQVHEKESGAVDILTKGDNNQVDDRGLYAGEPRAPA